MAIARLSLLFLMSILLISCKVSEPFEADTANLSSVQEKSKSQRRAQAYRRASLIFLKKIPSEAEYQLTATRVGYEKLIKNLVDSPDFINSLREYHQDYFQMSGFEDGINYDEPANLAAYLIQQNKDFRAILTANYCIDNSLNLTACSSFSNSPDQASKNAAGVITTQAFLKKWSSAFNFKRTSKTFSFFACHDYPDESDPGVSVYDVSDKVHTFNCTNCSPRCYSCHSTMNPRASLYYTFDISGKFNLNPSAELVTKTDTNEPSTVDDLLVARSRPLFNGQVLSNLRQYATYLSQSEKFSSCLARRLTLFALGGDVKNRMPENFQFVNNAIVANGYRIRDFMYQILVSEAYVQQ